LGFSFSWLFRCYLLAGHFGVEVEEFFEAFSLRERFANGVAPSSILSEAAIAVDAL